MNQYFIKIFIILLFIVPLITNGQCPTATIDKQVYRYTADDFTDYLNNPLLIASTYINVDASPDCAWDFYVNVTSFTSSLYTSAVAPAQGSFDLNNIRIRAVNVCETAEEECLLAPSRICNTFKSPSSFVGGAAPHYIVGTAAVDGVDNLLTIGPCVGTIYNDLGDVTTSPNTHRFRIDFELDFSQFLLAAAPNKVITPGFYQLNLQFVVENDATGLQDIESFSLDIDIQPILQLKMTTATQLDFDFTSIKDYKAGVIKYGATILEVSSNMNWDLFAIGTSTRNESGGGVFWDNMAAYSTAGSLDIPLSSLELYQIPANPIGGADYSNSFVVPPVGANNIEVASGGASPLPVGGKTIAGDWGLTAVGSSIEPGSYLVPNAAWSRNDFRYVMTYKLTPGLPSVFSNGLPALGTFARPGVYSMQVRYLLTEDQ